MAGRANEWARRGRVLRPVDVAFSSSGDTAIIYVFNRINSAFPSVLTPLLSYAERRLETILWDIAAGY